MLLQPTHYEQVIWKFISLLLCCLVSDCNCFIVTLNIIFSIIMLLNTWCRCHWTRKRCEVCNFCYWSGNWFFYTSCHCCYLRINRKVLTWFICVKYIELGDFFVRAHKHELLSVLNVNCQNTSKWCAKNTEYVGTLSITVSSSA
jgi:hypothetical protein